MGSSVGQQMAELYLRGSLCNVTMKNLSITQQLEVDKIVEDVSNDPLLQPCRTEFNKALCHTIRGDYNDGYNRPTPNADQEFMVAIWRAAVAALYGYGKHPPSPETLNDKIQRKKWFQTWAFNYLRQILLENKRTYRTTTETIFKSVFEVVKSEIQDILVHNYSLNSKNNTATIKFDADLLPRNKIRLLNKLIDEYTPRGIKFAFTNEYIEFRCAFETIKEELLDVISTSNIQSDSEVVEINADLNSCSSETIQALHSIINKYAEHKVSVSLSENNITIYNSSESHEVSEVKIQNRVSAISSTQNNDDEEDSMPEIQDMNLKQFKDPDTIKLYYDSLSEDAKKVMNIMIDAPDDYIDKYKGKVCQKYIGEFLNLDKKDLTKIYSEMRIKFVSIIGQPD